jgi:hypothetical protein
LDTNKEAVEGTKAGEESVEDEVETGEMTDAVSVAVSETGTEGENLVPHSGVQGISN